MLVCLEGICRCLRQRMLDRLTEGFNIEEELLLERLENPCALVDRLGSTVLHYAVKNDNAQMIQHLIDAGCKVDAQDNYGVTPLMLAVKAENPRTVKILIKNNADIYVADKDGKSVLEQAFRLRLYKSNFHILDQDCHCILEMFFEKTNADFLNGSLQLTQLLHSDNDTVKFAVVALGNAEITRYTLEHGYPINFHLSTRNSSTHPITVDERARERGIDLSNFILIGYTALHCALLFVRFENVKILIEHGASLDTVEGSRITTPFKAYLTSFQKVDEKSEVLKNMLERSTNMLTLSSYGIQEIDRFLQLGNTRTVRTVLQSIDVNEFLKKADKPLIHFLLPNKTARILEVLDELNIKYDVNERDSSDFTPLITASSLGCPRKVEFLLERGADVTLRTSVDGHSALSETCLTHPSKEIEPVQGTIEEMIERDKAKIVELLLEYGTEDADVKSFFKQREFSSTCLTDQILLAHSAMLKAQGKSSLTNATHRKIKSNCYMQKYFERCTKHVEMLKCFTLNGKVTLYSLLTEKEETVLAYSRNQELISAFNKAMPKVSHLTPHYVNVLKRRYSRLMNAARLQQEVALAIEILTGLCSDIYKMIVDKIASYLDRQDLYNLCKISRKQNLGRKRKLDDEN